MIEIKPESQSRPPKKGKTKKAERRYIKESVTWAINSAKWDAAQEYCKDRGWKWMVWNEKHIGVKYGAKKPQN